MSQTEEFIINLRQIQMAILDYANKPLQDPALKKKQKQNKNQKGQSLHKLTLETSFFLKLGRKDPPIWTIAKMKA